MAGSLKKNKRCDILVAGAGLAGLSLVYRAIKAGHWKDLSIIIVDQNINAHRPTKNWSFWKKSSGPFDQLISKSWKKLSFFSAAGVRKPLLLDGYSYHTIKSRDFYKHCLLYLGEFENISFVEEEILSVTTNETQCYIETLNYSLSSTYLFNSVYTKPALNPGTQYFLQHFKGLLIESEELQLDPEEAYLMDFRTSQEHGTTFFYTLPLSRTRLFVEYTIFSKSLLDQEEYDEKLSVYLQNILQIKEYQVLEHEYGVIPMTDHPFQRFQGNIINIGSAGGDTRAATGYTFTNVQKTIDSILACWSATGTPFFKSENISLKHQIYDSCLLNVLDEGTYEGHQIFEDLFMRSKASKIFRFLDAESSLLDDAAIIPSLKTLPFAKAMASVLSGKLKSSRR
jgi:lycopene beta-cyclase